MGFGGAIMKRLTFIVTIVAALVCGIPLQGYSATGPQMTDYCSTPPFLTQAVEPNILLVIDMSGSMQFPAHGPENFTYYSNKVAQCGSLNTTYDGTKEYYGYFKTDKFYQYSSNKFIENGDCTVAQWNDKTSWSSTKIPGNLLNWATMSRIDVLRKVLIGGKSVSLQLNTHTLLSEGGTWSYTDSNLKCTFSVSGGTTQAHTITVSNCCSGTCPFTLSGANVKVDVPEAERVGVVQELADRDYDGDWDTGAPRFGTMIYNTDGNVGKIVSAIGDSSLSSFVTDLQNIKPYWGTPTGEALINALIYYEQDTAATQYYNNNAYVKGPGSSKDPWEDWCQLSFILLVSDGEWSEAIDPVVPAREGRLGTHGGRTGDLRDSVGDLEGDQVVTTYAVYAFSDTAAGRNSLQQTAMYGGFTDKDANTWPYAYTGYPADSKTVSLPQTNCNPSGTYNDYCYEWEVDQDGIPDNYYEATEGSKLKDEITEAIFDMLRRASSGTAVSVLSTSTEGEGSLMQAFFNYEVVEGTRSVYWVGYLNGLWIDQYGQVREDTIQDQALVLSDDNILEFFVDTDGVTKIKKYADSDGDGVVYPDDPDDSGNSPVTYGLEYLYPIWEGGTKLALRSASDRVIYTFIDSDQDGVPGSGEWGSDKFVASNASTLRPFLYASDTTEAQNIINFIRGEHVSTMRDRRVTVNTTPDQVWKLSDIVYSTPVIVGAPMMNYHIIYGDSTYHEYYRDYKERRQTVYVGANDGMLHAFNGGFYHEGDDSSTVKTERGWYSDPAGNGQIGKELWAYIPYNLLPHLKWLTDHDYCHVYYVDLKPKIVDARIFTPNNDPDTTHSYGWGTILIGGMKLGGGEIELTDDFGNGNETRTFRSAYFAIDITDPQNPDLLWEFTDADLGFTTSYPNVIRVGPRDQVGDWYAIFGSGVASYDGEGAITTRYVYVLNLKTGALVRKIDMKDAVGEDDIDGYDVFMADPISVDLHVDYQVDSAYIGATYCTLNTCDADDWKGKMFRININENTNVAEWTYSTMMSLDRPVTAAPTAAVDMFNRLWIYFGTGRYFNQDDREDLTTTQNLFGVWDPGTVVSPGTDLNDVTDVYVYENGYVDVNGDGSYDASDTTFSQYLSARRSEYNSGSSHGWKITLTSGERSLHKPTILGGIVLFPTFKPTADVCGYGGTSYLSAPYYETGTAYAESVIGFGTAITINGNPYKEILRKTTLGSGMPTNAVIHSGQEEGVMSLIQLGTGVIKQLQVIPAISPKSQTLFWEERR
jgi:Tfp pilus tip-associated adhesin PilY1